MNSILLFLFLCIPARIGIALGSKYVPDKYLKVYASILLLMGLSFIYLYFTNKRLDSPEAGGKTWWAQYRLIIGFFYISAAIYAFQGRRDLIWIPLVMDIIFGIIIFAKHHNFF
jgi:uncharacterized membrane protein YfcA